MLVLGDGNVTTAFKEDEPLVTGLARLLFVVFMVGINVFMLNLMINLMDDFMCVAAGGKGSQPLAPTLYRTLSML